MHLIESAGQLLWGEADATEIATGAAGAIVAIVLAGVGEEHLEEIDLLAVGQHSRVDPAVQVVAHPGGLCATGLTTQIILSRTAQCLDLLARIHANHPLPTSPCEGEEQDVPLLRREGPGEDELSIEKPTRCLDCLYYTNKCSKCQESTTTTLRKAECYSPDTELSSQRR